MNFFFSHQRLDLNVVEKKGLVSSGSQEDMEFNLPTIPPFSMISNSENHALWFKSETIP